MKIGDSYRDQWNEMVFENRNKDYGAYSIRKIYVKHVITGLTLSIIVIAVFILLPKIIAYFNDGANDDLTNFKGVVYTELASPPPIEKNSPKIAASSSIEVMHKFLAPKVTHQNIQDEPFTKEIEDKVNTQNDTDENGDIDGLIEGEGGNDYVLDMAEIMPQYPGGMEAMTDFISKNIRYPLSAQRMRISGVVFISFIVNTDGTIDDVHTTKGIFEDCDKEAERVVRIMPPWEPGRQEGKPVKVRFVLPIKFRLGSLVSVKKQTHTLLQ